jgi:hypothetical protein
MVSDNNIKKSILREKQNKMNFFVKRKEAVSYARCDKNKIQQVKNDIF